jgi:hypothetical protein
VTRAEWDWKGMRLGRLGVLLVAAVALVASVAVLSANAMKSTREAFSPTRAIQTALKYDNSWELVPFPRQVGRVACQMPAGGPGDGSYAGWCETRVKRTPHHVLVTFTEVWETKVFRSTDDPNPPFETHSWIALETPNLRVIDFFWVGDIAPQDIH